MKVTAFGRSTRRAKLAVLIALTIVASIGGESARAAVGKTQRLISTTRSVPHTGGFMLPAVKGGQDLVYLSDSRGSQVVIWPQGREHGGGPIGEITGLNYPTGIAVNAGGDLFVQITGGSNKGIMGFHRGSTVPFTMLSGGGGIPLAFDIDGNLYAGTTTNQVDVYAPGATSPTRRFRVNGLVSAWSIAVDHKGNIFCGGAKTNGSFGDTFPVYELKPDGSQRTIFINLGFLGGLAMGGNGELVVQDSGYRTISIYKKPYKGQQPVGQVAYPTDSYVMALTHNRKRVWISSILTQRGSEGQEYDFTTGDRVRVTKGGNLGVVLEGVAIDPPAL